MTVPILNASGCLDALTAAEVAQTLDVFVTKTVTPLPREGNPPPRIAETELGMLNSIGLQNPGIEAFLDDTLPRLARLGVPLWVSVGGFSVQDYAQLCTLLSGRREAEAHRPWQYAAGRLEHEELPRRAGLEAATLDAEERVRADRLAGGDPTPFPHVRSAPAATWRPQSARSRSRARPLRLPGSS